jgi:hypothetical protein
MATTIILPPAAAIETAANELRAAAEGNNKRLVALNKASYDLLVLQPQIVRIAGAYLVPSTSRGGLVHRVDDLNGCDCEAGRKGCQCRHAVALELIEEAHTHTIPALPVRRSSDAEYLRACAEMNELFA